MSFVDKGFIRPTSFRSNKPSYRNGKGSHVGRIFDEQLSRAVCNVPVE